jgi:hypothetical protein
MSTTTSGVGSSSESRAAEPNLTSNAKRVAMARSIMRRPPTNLSLAATQRQRWAADLGAGGTPRSDKFCIVRTEWRTGKVRTIRSGRFGIGQEGPMFVKLEVVATAIGDVAERDARLQAPRQPSTHDDEVGVSVFGAG